MSKPNEHQSKTGEKTSVVANPPSSATEDAAETGNLSSTFGIGSIFIADFAVAAVFGACAALVVETTGWHDIPGNGTWSGFLFAILAVGLVPLLWLGHGIVWPHVKTGRMGRFLWAPEYEYCSTHPSYVLIDLLMIPIFLSTFADIPSADSTASLDHRASVLRGDAMVIVACEVLGGIAFMRLICWYVFKRRLPPEDSRRAWLPVAVLLGLAMLLFVMIKIANRSRAHV